MNKSDLVATIAHRAGLSTAQAEKAFSVLTDTIRSNLQSVGASVSISGFGKFMVKERAPRKGRNPHTNEPICIPARPAIVFKPSEKLKDIPH